KLKITDPVSKYVPDSPPAWEKITLHHLLSHTAAVPNYTAFDDYRPTMPLPTTPLDLVKRFRDRPLDFEPGSKFSYSNSGYSTLGYVIEKASGQTYEKFVQENIFDTLGLR